MKRNFSEEKLLQRKRQNSLNSNEEDKEIEVSNKLKSAENDKVKVLKNQYEIDNFMASKNLKFKNNDNSVKEKLTGDNLNFDLRRKKAEELINSIEQDKSNNIEKIEEALYYDNTNKYAIYLLLKYYYDKKDKTNYDKTLKEYKYCITKRFKIIERKKEIEINLNNFNEIKEPIEEFEELPYNKINHSNTMDLRNLLVDIFKNYYYISEDVNNLNNKNIKDNDLKEILIVEYTNNNDLCELSFKNEEKLKILEKYRNKDNKDKKELENLNQILTNIQNFLHKYLFLKPFESFQKNQPVSYKYNLTLYFNYIIFSLYEITICVDESNKRIIFKKEKLKRYFSLRKFHDLIFDELFDENEPINEIINQLLQFLLLLLSSEKDILLEYFVKSIHLENKEKFLDKNSAEELVKNLNDTFMFFKANIENDNIIFNDDTPNDKIIIKYSNYTDNFAKFNSRNFFDLLFNETKFQSFQTNNFFNQNDIDYLKYLIKCILSSQLFKSIFEKYNNITDLSEYYFTEQNINDYLGRIIFLPFNVDHLGKYASTDRNILSVLVCGFAEKSIYGLYYYRIFRILELALRSIILGSHEPSHFIKRAYSIITKGEISRNTSDNDTDIESGFIMEEILFGWIVDKENPLDLSKFNLSPKIEYKNEIFKGKKINLITALNLLNPKIYSQDLTFFRKCIYEITKEDLKTFNISSPELDPVYSNYLKTVLSDNIIKSFWNEDISINASMKIGDSFAQYIRFNHNSKH